MTDPRPSLTRDAILAQKTLRQETVDVPEWGGTVIVQELTGKERDAFEASCVQKKGTRSFEMTFANIRARLIVRAVRAADGARLFADTDVDALGELSAQALNRLFAVAQRLSGMTEADVEDLVKNSASGPSGSSPIGSPTASE